MKKKHSLRRKKLPTPEPRLPVGLLPDHGLEGLLNKKDAARYLGVAQRTLDSYLLRRKIPFYKLGVGRTARIRFKRTDLEAALEKYRVDAVDGQV